MDPPKRVYEALFELVKEKDYFVNNLLNCAGFGDRCDLKDMDPELQVKLNNVNVNALFYFTQAFSKIMLEKNEGHIINVSSIAGFVPLNSLINASPRFNT